jgi:hypothetical protein
MEYYDQQPTLNTSMTWQNDYPLNSPGAEQWFNQTDDLGMFENEPLQTPTTDMYIQPQALNMYNLSTSNSSRNHTANYEFSDASSPEALSHCDDDLTLRSPKQESLYAPSPPNAVATAPRKRGRPRTVRTAENTLYDESHAKPSKPSKRQPHNQVERKYREGLNAELERLRLALPTLHKWEMAASCGGSGMPKASKAAVLAGAVAYIQDMERERDHLRRENELLKSGRGMRRSYE